MIIKIFVIAEDQSSEVLIAEVERIPGCRAEVYTCPKMMETVQPMPFIQVDGGERFYGKENIVSFVAEKASEE